MIGMEAETPRWTATDLLVALCAFCLVAAWTRSPGSEAPVTRTSARASLDISKIQRGAAPLPPPAKSLSTHRRSFGYRIVLGPEGAVVQLKGAPAKSPSRVEFQNKPFGVPGAIFGIKLLGADPSAQLEHAAKSKSALSKVYYSDVYPSIDWVWLGARDQIEYDFVVRPGGDPARIRLSFENVAKSRIDQRGDLVLHVGKHEIRQAAPYAYQLSNGGRKRVEARYVNFGKEGIGLRVGRYDRTKPLVID